MPHIVAISGKSGCGNTTVSERLAARLGYRFINHTFRTMAPQKGMSLDELLELAKRDDSWDRLLDEEQKALARGQDSVVGSRLAMWMLPEATLRVYLWGSVEVRADRIHDREGGDHVARREETLRRDASDHARYLRIYGIDNDDYSSADIVINTERFRPDDIVALCLAALERKLSPGMEHGKD